MGEGRIRFALPAAGHVRIALFDSRGGLVARLLDANRTAGNHGVDLPANLPRGAYLLSFRAGNAELKRWLTWLD